MPVTDCFLLTMYDLEQCFSLKTVLSSRYELIITELTSADNWRPNLIDNTVCTNWSFEGFHYKEAGNLDIATIRAGSLCDPHWVVTWNIQQEQEYAMMCRHWIAFLNVQKNKYLNVQKSLDFIKIPQLENNRYQTLVSQIYLAMYLGRDTEQVDNHIKHLIENCDTPLIQPRGQHI